MRLLTFIYEKNDGSMTRRALLPLSEPSNFLSGIDLSSLSEAEVREYAAAYNAIKNEFDAKMAVLNTNYKVAGSFRRFKIDGISDNQTKYI